MGIDLIIVLVYFAIVMFAALSGKGVDNQTTSEAYFLSNRNLKWYSIAISTVATNIQGYQFLGMMGSAYLYGLAQANLEINAVQGMLLAAFVFVPMYLRHKVVTVTQFIKMKLGETVGLLYSSANLLLFSTIGLGAALFWGAYAADFIFADQLSFISNDKFTRTSVLVICLGVFSAIYTYFGGLSAVVRTDIIQFGLLTLGGIILTVLAVKHLGGWAELYRPSLDSHMHLHLPADHPKLPWLHMFGLFFLNINYWCANQSVLQRSLAARSLKDAQIGLMAGGVMKYLMAIIIVVPGIALYGILGDQLAADPDQTFPYLVREYLPMGLRGIIVCALFASLMSTVDSLFNSMATLFSIDIYKTYIKPNANDQQVVSTGQRTIIFTLFTGVAMGIFLLYMKLGDSTSAFTHILNEMRYYVNCGIVVVICASAFLIKPDWRITTFAFLITIPLNIALKAYYPEMNYFFRAFWVIVLPLAIVAAQSIYKNGLTNWQDIFHAHSPTLRTAGWVLAASLVLLHVVFG